jgi:hypothetical protein
MSIRQIQLKLPPTYQDKWSKIVENTRRNSGREANFADFVKLIDYESSIINDPVYSRVASNEKKPEKKIVNIAAIKPPTKKEVSFAKCIICDAEHDLDDCEEFTIKSMEEKKQILYDENLCFACYKKGHISIGCTERKNCTICKRSHPTALHIKTNTLTTYTDQSSIIAMCIIPVIVYHSDHPEIKQKVYAIIDNCSQGTFGTEDLLLTDLALPARETTLTIETAIGTETVHTYAIDNLIVKCTNEHKTMYPDSPDIKLPRTYTRSTLPANKADIASKEKTSNWTHLRHLAKKMPEYDENVPIGLLIGLNCPRAQEPHEVVLGEDNSPYAMRNAFGWCIMGPVGKPAHTPAKCNHTNISFPSKDIQHGSMSKHHFTVAEKVKDNGIKDRLQEMWSTDFSERHGENQALSQEDKKFIDLIRHATIMFLPFFYVF